jgi:hypothetical protein
MKYKPSDWYKGLLYAEHMNKEGWKIDCVDFPRPVGKLVVYGS